ncbi:MAG: hypothetical protein JNL07_04750 [Rhodospirillales bacterium]|nr:hypothetical protein [Rhodospirillales bacterium]
MNLTGIVRIAVLSAAGLSFVPPREASAQGLDGVYAGTIGCATMPGVTARQLRTPFRMTVTGGIATYEREVLDVKTNAPTGLMERGSGTVTPAGAISLTGRADGQASRGVMSYSGAIVGGAVTLAGTQTWSTGGTQQGATRPCTIELKRGG